MNYSKDMAKTIVNMCIDYTFDRISIGTFISNLRLFADFLEDDFLSDEKAETQTQAEDV